MFGSKCDLSELSQDSQAKEMVGIESEQGPLKT